MKAENVKQIITSLRSTLYVANKTYSDDFFNLPRPFYNFLLMIEGEAVFQLPDSTIIHAKRSDVVWIPKGSTFFVEWKGARASWHVIHFDFSFPFNPFLNKTSRPQILQVENAFLLLKDFQLLTNEKNPHLILSLFYRIFGNLYGRIKYEDEPKQTIIQPALDYLENHYKEKIYTDKLARLCLLSRSKFQSLFKEITKTSPIAYKNSLLIQSLQQALVLDEKKSLETLSVEFGFDSTVYLCKLFKKLTGKTPTEYRKCTFSL